MRGVEGRMPYGRFVNLFYLSWLAFAGLIVAFAVRWCQEMYKRFPDDLETMRTSENKKDKQIVIALWASTAVIVLVALAAVIGIVFYILNPTSSLYHNYRPAREVFPD